MPSAIRDEKDDYINITITPAEGQKAAAAAATKGENDLALQKNTVSALVPAGSPLRKQGKAALESNQTPPGSPALMRKTAANSASKSETVGPPPGYQKKRSKSDTTPILKEKERLRLVGLLGMTNKELAVAN